MACITPDGSRVWWFAEYDATENGSWYSSRFDGHDVHQEFSDLPMMAPLGLALSADGDVFVGYAIDGNVSVERRSLDGARRSYFRSSKTAIIEDLSPDGSVLLISHMDSGDFWSLRALLADGSHIELGTATTRFVSLGFSPSATPPRLLLKRISGAEVGLAVCDFPTGDLVDVPIPAEAASQVSWFPDGRSLLMVEDHPGKSLVWRVDLTDIASRVLVEVPDGVISHIAVRPDGDVWATYSSSTIPTILWSRDKGTLIEAPRKFTLEAVAEEHWVENNGQKIHTLVTKPVGAGPFPTVILLHGGPQTHDDFSFSPRVAAWASKGYAVVRPNYRGSTGYGDEWQSPANYVVGETELSDITSVRRWAVNAGLAVEGQIIISGGSWGGYLALIAAGRAGYLWDLVIAINPIADYVAAFEDESPLLQRLDEVLFGGNPQKVSSAYLAASPITYVGGVSAPVLLIAGLDDPRCPIRQIRNYEKALRARNALCETYTYVGGHGPRNVEERIAQMAIELSFASTHLHNSF